MFLAPAQFDFIAGLRSVWQDVREEYLALPQESFEPWVQREMYGQGWSVYGLVAFGDRIEDALATCPGTAAALSLVPRLTTEHEVWNRSDQTRTVLLFDFVRPGHEASPPDKAPPGVREFIQQRTGRAPEGS